MEIGARLHHLQLLSPDADRCAAFYARAYAMVSTAAGEDRLCAGHERHLLISPGPANRLGYAAFAFGETAAFEAYRRRVAAAIAAAPFAAAWFEPGAFSVADPDGNSIVFGVAQPERATAAPAPDAPPPARLQHFALRTSEPSRLLAFYRDVLGFVVSDRVCDDAGTVRACFLRTDAEHHALALFQSAETRHDHLSFETADWLALRDWADRMSRLRLPIAWGVGRHGPGNDTFFMIRDPDGNLAEISAELEVCTPARAEGRWTHEERTLNLWGSAIMRS